MGSIVMERMKPRFFEPYHCTILRIPLYEIDIGGGVYHGNYFHFFEIARDDFFRHLGFPYKKLVDEYLMHLTVAQVTCTYFAPLHYDDMVTVVTGVEELRSRSIVMVQRIDRKELDGAITVCVQALFALVCVGGKEGRRVSSLPEPFRNAIKKWLNGV
ncbi:MAG: acyl-CoA thioesterase [Syntrophobacterales bacterium]|nr:acyl-CoA thioesterase [Syntrophobacterales bacterium]